MPHLDSNRHKPALALTALAVLLAAALLLAACGGSSKASSSSSSSSSSTAKAPVRAAVRARARAAALRSCLQKNGVTPPKGKPGQGGAPGARGPFGGSGQLPTGVSRAKLQAALKKCGGGNLPRAASARRAAGGGRRLAKFAACMRKNGVKLPAPNTSGKGPIFDTKGIDTNSAKFNAADVKCMRELAPAKGTGTGAAAGPPGP